MDGWVNKTRETAAAHFQFKQTTSQTSKLKIEKTFYNMTFSHQSLLSTLMRKPQNLPEHFLMTPTIRLASLKYSSSFLNLSAGESE